MIRRKVDHVLFGGLVVMLALLMHVPPFLPESAPVSAAEACPDAWMLLQIENTAAPGSDPPFVFSMRATPTGGAYEAHMTIEGHAFVLSGSVSSVEFNSFMTGLEAHRSSASACARGDVRTTRAIHLMSATGGAFHDTSLDAVWSPQYQSLQRFLDHTIVGRSQEALKKAAGF